MPIIAPVPLKQKMCPTGSPKDWGEGLFAAPEHLQSLVQLPLSQLHLREWTQVKITLGSDKGARLTRRHLAVAHVQEPVTTYTRLHALDAGHIERVIGTLTRHHIRGQGHAQRIENGLHHFDLRQVGTIILTMTKLKQAFCAHRGI